MKTWLLSLSDYHCMNCKKAFMYEHLVNILPRTFIDTTLKEQHASILMSMEKSLLPDTQEKIKKYEQIKRLEKQKDKIRALKRKLDLQIDKINKAVRKIKYPEDVEKKTNNFILPCPVENCRGFLTNGWTCGICNTKICKLCREVKGEEHNCDEDIVKTVALLKTDTKPCPSCGTYIHRIEGCAQMFCLNCKKGFDWNTGVIITGNFHNPHYYEWLQKQSDQNFHHNEIGCENNWQDYYYIETYCRTVSNIYSKEKNIISVIHQDVLHINHVINYSLRNKINKNKNNEDLRIKYLLKDINETKFKSLLATREKKREKDTSLLAIMDMYVQASGDFFINLTSSRSGRNIIIDIIDSFKQLQIYTWEQLVIMSKTFKCKIPFDIITIFAKYINTFEFLPCTVLKTLVYDSLS